MLLVFTEVVDITTLNFDEFVFQSAADVHPDTEAISYFNRSMLLSTVDSKEILLDLSELFADIRSRFATSAICRHMFCCLYLSICG